MFWHRAYEEGRNWAGKGLAGLFGDVMAPSGMYGFILDSVNIEGIGCTQDATM